MYNLGAVLATLMLSTTLALADIPKELYGSWILDTQATEHNILASANMKPEDEKYLPTIIRGMSKYVWRFNDDAITASKGTKEDTLAVVLKESDKKTHVFEGQMGDQTILMTVTFISDGVINIRSSATDDMKYYLWKRDLLDMNKKEYIDASLAVELMEISLHNLSNKTSTGNGM